MKWKISCAFYISIMQQNKIRVSKSRKELIFFTILPKMNENSLMRLGIIHPEHRYESSYHHTKKHVPPNFRQFIWREIAKLRLRTSILYLRDQERRLASNAAMEQFWDLREMSKYFRKLEKLDGDKCRVMGVSLRLVLTTITLHFIFVYKVIPKSSHQISQWRIFTIVVVVVYIRCC